MLVALLLASVAHAGVPTRMPPDPVKGKRLYDENCWQCHGEKGLGDGPAAAGLATPAPALAGRLDLDKDSKRLVGVIEDGKGEMPSFSQVMDRYDARRVLVYLASLDPTTGEPPDDDQDATPSKPGVHAARPKEPFSPKAPARPVVHPKPSAGPVENTKADP